MISAPIGSQSYPLHSRSTRGAHENHYRDLRRNTFRSNLRRFFAGAILFPVQFASERHEENAKDDSHLTELEATFDNEIRTDQTHR